MKWYKLWKKCVGSLQKIHLKKFHVKLWEIKQMIDLQFCGYNLNFHIESRKWQNKYINETSWSDPTENNVTIKNKIN